MKLKLFFLMAAAALAVGCSSDDDGTKTEPGGGAPPEAENVVESQTAVFENNTSMSAGWLEGVETRADKSQYVAVRLPENLGIEKEWLCEADDFNLRIGEDVYVNLVEHPEADKGMWVERYDAATEGRDGLKVAVYGLDELPADSTEYTYEVYLWVRDTAWGVDSLTNLEAVITPEEKAEWVSGDGQGTDITELCSSWQTAGYAARYNVYKGLAGHDDTPYVKVSIHIMRDADAQAGPAEAVTPEKEDDGAAE